MCLMIAPELGKLRYKRCNGSRNVSLCINVEIAATTFYNMNISVTRLEIYLQTRFQVKTFDMSASKLVGHIENSA